MSSFFVPYILLPFVFWQPKDMMNFIWKILTIYWGKQFELDCNGSLVFCPLTCVSRQIHLHVYFVTSPLLSELQEFGRSQEHRRN